MKKLCFIFTLFVVLSCVNVVSARDTFSISNQIPSNIYAKGAYAVELGQDMLSPEDDTVLISRGYKKRFYPASLTKIMTAAVVLENMTVEQLKNTTFTQTQEIYDTVLRRYGSSADFKPNEVISLYDVFYGLMLPSGCDASIMLATHLAGSEAKFVEMMNETAARIGMKDSHFANSSGWDDAKQYVTIEDLEKLTKYVFFSMPQKEFFAEVVGTFSHTLPATNIQPERILENSNRLLPGGAMAYDGIVGVKTGATYGAGHCLVCYYVKDDIRIITIVLYGSALSNKTSSFENTRNMLEWTSKNFFKGQVDFSGKTVFKANVKVSENAFEELPLTTNFSTSRMLPVSYMDLLRVVPKNLPQEIQAPIKKGEKLADATLFIGDVKMGEIELIASTDVEQIIIPAITPPPAVTPPPTVTPPPAAPPVLSTKTQPHRVPILLCVLAFMDILFIAAGGFLLFYLPKKMPSPLPLPVEQEPSIENPLSYEPEPLLEDEVVLEDDAFAFEEDLSVE